MITVNPIKIKDHLTEVAPGVFEVNIFNFTAFGEYFFTHPIQKMLMQYNSLVRFYVYTKLLRYDGVNETILSYIEGLKSKDKLKIEILNKIPNNQKVMRYIIEKFNLGFPLDYKYADKIELKKLIAKHDEIFNDANLLEYIKIVNNVSDAAKKSEKIVKGVINMIYGKWYDILPATLSEDLKGVDIWKINKETGIKESIQIKNIPGTITMTNNGSVIFINNTLIDLHTYKKTKTSLPLPYDILGFYSAKDQKICLINCNAIFTITSNTEKKFIRIQIDSWAMEEKWYKNMVKFRDIHKKFIGKDFSKIFV
jgi:hypothetical protein